MSLNLTDRLKGIGRSIGRSAGKALATAGLTALAFLPSYNRADAGIMKIETYPVQSTWKADGTTIYEVQVRADSTDIPTKKIRSAEWDFTVPSELESYLTFVGSSKPSTANPSTNPNDAFYNLSMNSSFNRVDSIISSGELDDNARLTNPSTNGFQNIDFEHGILGSYFFTLATNTPKGDYNFGLHSIYFYDTDSVGYVSLDGGNYSKINVNNQSFQITPEPATLAFLAIGGSLIGLKEIRTRRKNN